MQRRYIGYIVVAPNNKLVEGTNSEVPLYAQMAATVFFRESWLSLENQGYKIEPFTLIVYGENTPLASP